jgi:hypothetical protein
VIRRLFWMAVGAVLGVTGYRRVSRLARAITPGTRRGGGNGAQRRHEPLAGPALFARDVRDGAAEYMSRHAGQGALNLGGQHAGERRRRETGQAGALPGTHYPEDGH